MPVALSVIAAVMWLAPAQSHKATRTYADLISFEAMWYNVDPLLIVSIIQVESGFKSDKKSKTNDYGLMQVHVARRGSGNFYGREKLLFDPRVNIREGTRILAMWRSYHNCWCKGDHPYWAHYKWGKKVKDTRHAFKVKAIYTTLVRKFRPQRVKEVACSAPMRWEN